MRLFNSVDFGQMMNLVGLTWRLGARISVIVVSSSVLKLRIHRHSKAEVHA